MKTRATWIPDPWFLALLLLLGLMLLFAPGCAKKAPQVLAGAQGTHDLIALAQDEEVQLCLGVPNVAAAMTLPVVNHCTTEIAKTIKLTDARHQKLEAQMATVWSLYMKGVRLAQAGTAANGSDQATLQAAVDAVLGILAELTSTPAVVQISTNIKAGVK